MPDYTTTWANGNYRTACGEGELPRRNAEHVFWNLDAV